MPSPVFGRRKYATPSELRRDDLDLHVWALAIFLVIMGGFTAGCNAGHVSDIWPLIFGRLIPPGLLSQVQPAALNLVDALLTVAFIHRWLAFIGLIAAIVIHRNIRRINTARDVLTGIRLLVILVVLQIVLGSWSRYQAFKLHWRCSIRLMLLRFLLPLCIYFTAFGPRTGKRPLN